MDQSEAQTIGIFLKKIDGKEPRHGCCSPWSHQAKVRTVLSFLSWSSNLWSIICHHSLIVRLTWTFRSRRELHRRVASINSEPNRNGSFRRPDADEQRQKECARREGILYRAVTRTSSTWKDINEISPAGGLISLVGAAIQDTSSRWNRYIRYLLRVRAGRLLRVRFAVDRGGGRWQSRSSCLFPLLFTFRGEPLRKGAGSSSHPFPRSATRSSSL